MLETTKNYGLLKPTSDEFYDVGIQNGNMDQVDQALKELEDSKAKQTDVDASIESLDQKMIAKADRENPGFTGKVIVPELSADPSDNEAATVKFVRENGGGAAAGVSITEKTQETTGAGGPNVESALGSVGTRLGSLETAVPSPTESGTILYSAGEGVRRNIPFLIGEPKPISNFAVERFSTLGSLNVGDKVKFGSYNGVPITWRIADKNHEGYPAGSVTLITDKIITLKCFDAGEALSIDSGRKTSGSNRYICSNIRQWLNSDATEGKWYSAQHSADLAPSNANVWSNYNEYDQEAGFLSGFSANMRTALIPTMHAVGKSSTDGGGTETCEDKVFLASCTEVGLTGDVVCGSKLALFSSDASRQACPTPACVSKSEYTNSDFNTGVAWFWWLCDAYASNSYYARNVNTSGVGGWNGAFHGTGGVRPLCNVSEGTRVEMDADGTYTILESNDGLNLTWSNPTDLLIPQTVRIRRSSEAYPATLEEGVEVYSGSDESYLDETADLSMDQYYTAWVDNSMVTKTDESMMVKYSHGVDYLMLYDHGDECVDVTGGWINANEKNPATITNNGNSKTATRNSDVTGGSIGFSSINKIGCTGYGEVFQISTATRTVAYNGHKGAVNTRLTGTVDPIYGRYNGEVVTKTNFDFKTNTGNETLQKNLYKTDLSGVIIPSYFTFDIGGVERGEYTLFAAFLLRTDDYTRWLRAGNLNPSDYPTLDSLLNDETAMGVLMNSSAAVDMMIRYTGTVMAGVINSETAMTALGLSTYVTRVMQNPDWRKFIFMSPYLETWKTQANTKKIPVMTSNTVPSGTAAGASDSYKAFDGSTSTYAVIGNVPSQLSYQFDEDICAFGFEVTSWSSGRCPEDYEIRYEKADESYGVVAEKTDSKQGTAFFSPRPYSGEYAKWVFHAKTYRVGDNPAVSEFQVYGK